jgi:hypothetical protein
MRAMPGFKTVGLGQEAANHVPASAAAQLEALYRERYAGSTAKHFHEHLVRDHSFRSGYTWTKVFLQSTGLLEHASRRGAHRRRRPRRPLPRMMSHQDASKREWMCGQPVCDLVVTLNDGTSAIYSASWYPRKARRRPSRGCARCSRRMGRRPASARIVGVIISTRRKWAERLSGVWSLRSAGALAQLRIEHIAAYSPEARGRSERVFRTLQDRLPKEFELARDHDRGGGLRETFVSEHNKRFAIAAEQPGSAFVLPTGIDLREVPCHQEARSADSNARVDHARGWSDAFSC